MKTCKKCGIEKSLDQFRVRNQRGKPYVEAVCKRCNYADTAARAKERRKTDPEFRARMYQAHKKYVASEKGRKAKLDGQRRYLNSEHGRLQTRESNRQQRLKDPAKDCFRVRTRHLSKLNRVPAWADLAAIHAVYAEAARLTLETGIIHQVDHIVPLNSPIVSGLHWHENLRPLPAEENAAKNNMFWPDMPDDPQDVVRSFGLMARGRRAAQAYDVAELSK